MDLTKPRNVALYFQINDSMHAGIYFEHNKIITVDTFKCSPTYIQLYKNEVLLDYQYHIKQIIALNDGICVIELVEPFRDKISYIVHFYLHRPIEWGYAIRYIGDKSPIEYMYHYGVLRQHRLFDVRFKYESGDIIPATINTTIINGECVIKYWARGEILGFLKTENTNHMIIMPNIKYFFFGEIFQNVRISPNDFVYWPQMSRLQHFEMFKRILRVNKEISYNDYASKQIIYIAVEIFNNALFTYDELKELWYEFPNERNIIRKRLSGCIRLKHILREFLKSAYDPPDDYYPGGFFYRCAFRRFENQSLVRAAAPPSLRD